MLKNKRSQLTIFIVIGIMLVIVASLLFFVARNTNTLDTKQSLSAGITESDSIKSLVHDCVDNAAEQSVILVGQQGGYVYLPDKKIELEDYSIVYDYYEGQNLLPTKDQIAQDMSKYVSENVVRCVDDSKSKFNSELEFGELKTIVNIAETAVSFDVDYPTTVKYFEKTEKLDDKFKTKVDVRLDYVLNASRAIIDSIVADPSWINFGLLSGFDITANMINYDADTVFVLEDSKSVIDNNNFTFIFANKFKENMPPYLFPFDNYEITPGQRLIIQTKAFDPEGDEITYSSGADEILKTDKATGLMRFYTPTNPDGTPILGTYTFTIKATDSHGNYDEETLTIKVKG